jgi:dCTP deaminase
VTLEWIRLPKNLAAYVTGKSSWGRRGLIPATATGVHPGFKGCLTLWTRASS